MQKDFTLSFILHAVIIALAIFGLPLINRPLPVVEQPMVVSIANISDISNAPKKKIQRKPETEQPTPPKTAPKPQPEAAAPPKPVEKPEPPKQEPKPEPKPEPKKVEPKPEPKPTPKPEPKPKKPEPKKPEPKKPEPKKVEPKPEPKPEPKKVEEKKVEKPAKKVEPKPAAHKPTKPAKAPVKESKDDFANSILKSIKPSEQAEQADEVVDAPASPSSNSESISDKISASEMDLLRQQLAQCWNVPAGAPDPESLIVTLRLSMNADRTVKDAEVIKQAAGRYGDVAAESALRAIYSPQCNPLALPLNKYHEWKTFTIRFDPRQMVGF
jgi:hypothetical protein